MAESTKSSPADPLSLEARLARERSRAVLFGWSQAHHIGRFTVLEALGRGGMSVVYSAYDPKLDRRVALKLVSVDGDGVDDEHARARVLREARAMAQLSHAHVVPVHEVIDVGPDVAIAMELVDGVDLAKWLESGRPWRDALRRVLDAGRGLAAAHAAGLVHRDFKPQNVLVGHDGRVRVTDFGLARVVRVVRSVGGDRDREGSSGGFGSSTRSDGVAGTPAYIAPEVYAGRPADEASDQFALAVTAYQAVHGQLPFSGKDPGELAAAVQQGCIRPPPPSSRIPRRVRRVIARGLATAPEDRFGSVDALVDELAAALESRRRGLGLGLVLIFGGGAIWAAARELPVCPDPSPELDGIWDETRKAELTEVFGVAPVATAAETWSRVRPRLDDYREAWLDARRDACVAAHIRHEQSVHLSDLRMSCLDRGRRELSALIDQLAVVDATMVDRAVNAAAILPAVSRCNDPEALRRDPVAPPPEAIREEVERALAELAELEAMLRAGRGISALERLAELGQRATELGYTPLLARVQLQQAHGQEEAAGDPDASWAAAEASFETAVRARDDETAVQAAVQLVILAGILREHERATRWLAAADTLVRRQELGPYWEGYVLEGEGYHARNRDDFESAHVALQGALERYEGIEVPPHRRVELLLGLAAVVVGRARYDEAEPLARRALETAQQTLGPRHSIVGRAHQTLGAIFGYQGRYDIATEQTRRAREVFAVAYGEGHQAVADADMNLGALLTLTRRHDEALERLEAAHEVFERMYGPDSARVQDVLVRILEAYVHGDRNEDAMQLGTRLLASIEAARGPEDPELASVFFYTAQAAVDLRRYDEARNYAERALALAEQHRGPDHPYVAAVLGFVGQMHGATGSPAEALPLYARAVEILTAAGAGAADLVPIYEPLAMDLLALGRRAEAVEAAEAARRAYLDGGSDFDEARAVWEAWMLVNLDKKPAAAHRDDDDAPPHRTDE